MNGMPFKRVFVFEGQKYILVHEVDYSRLRELLTECEKSLTTAFERAFAAGDVDLANQLASVVYDIDGWEGTQLTTLPMPPTSDGGRDSGEDRTGA